jgi:hypothetical protein
VVESHGPSHGYSKDQIGSVRVTIGLVVTTIHRETGRFMVCKVITYAHRYLFSSLSI